MRNERTCVICGKTYEYCPNCSAYDNEPRWKFLFDTKTCKDIYGVLNAYKAESISADQARSKLSRLDPTRTIVQDSGFKQITRELFAKPAVDEKKNNNSKK